MSLLIANVVPFNRTMQVDVGALRAHLMWLLGNGVEGLVPLADEFLWLDPDEKEQVISVCCDVGAGRPVLPCVWSPAPGQLARLARYAEKCGAMGVVLPPPLLHRLPADALIAWYRTAVMAVHVPVFAWMHPSFGNDLAPPLLARLREEVGVAGFIDGYGDAFRTRRLARQFPGRVWLADDALAGQLHGLEGLAGFVSRAGNAWPEMATRLWKGQGQISQAWRSRVHGLAAAGDVGALKRLLRMGTRPPFTEAEQDALDKLPQSAFQA